MDQMSIYELSSNETVLSLLKNQTAKSIPDYGKLMHYELCNASMNYFDFGNTVLFLSDGRMVVDNNQTADIYDAGFCIELFVENSNNISWVSAYVCSSLSPTVTFKSPNANQQEENTCSREFDQASFYRILRIG